MTGCQLAPVAVGEVGGCDVRVRIDLPDLDVAGDDRRGLGDHLDLGLVEPVLVRGPTVARGLEAVDEEHREDDRVTERVVRSTGAGPRPRHPRSGAPRLGRSRVRGRPRAGCAATRSRVASCGWPWSPGRRRARAMWTRRRPPPPPSRPSRTRPSEGRPDTGGESRSTAKEIPIDDGSRDAASGTCPSGCSSPSEFSIASSSTGSSGVPLGASIPTRYRVFGLCLSTSSGASGPSSSIRSASMRRSRAVAPSKSRKSCGSDNGGLDLGLDPGHVEELNIAAGDASLLQLDQVSLADRRSEPRPRPRPDGGSPPRAGRPLDARAVDELRMLVERGPARRRHGPDRP